MLGDDQWGVIREHDASSSHADGACAAGHMGNEDGRGRAGNAGHAMVLRQPEAPVAKALGVARQVERVAEGLRGVAALCNGGEVEHGKRCHPARVRAEAGILNPSSGACRGMAAWYQCLARPPMR